MAKTPVTTTAKPSALLRIGFLTSFGMRLVGIRAGTNLNVFNYLSTTLWFYSVGSGRLGSMVLFLLVYLLRICWLIG